MTRTPKLPAGWSIFPVYRGCTTVREYAASYRGRGMGSFNRKLDAVDYILYSADARKLDGRNGEVAFDENAPVALPEGTGKSNCVYMTKTCADGVVEAYDRGYRLLGYLTPRGVAHLLATGEVLQTDKGYSGGTDRIGTAQWWKLA